MRVAWITHQLPGEPAERGPGLLSGRYAGGAEMSTETMIHSAPSGVSVDIFRPAELTTALPEGYDRTIIGATEQLTPALVADALARKGSFLMWLRSPQPLALRPLLEAAQGVSWPSEACARWHRWERPSLICPAPINPDEVPVGPKEDFALWAARDHPQKGRMNARLWAWQNEVKLVEMTNAPREDILDAMKRARYFVHLPKGIIDPCPRTVIEAELAGCELIVNDLVGRAQAEGRALADYLRFIPGRFWRWVSDNGSLS